MRPVIKDFSLHRVLSFPLLLGAALILAGCEEDDSWNTQDAIPIVVSDSLYYAAYEMPQAELSIENGEIRGDYLKFTVSFPGGCEEHEIGLIAPDFQLETNPPRIPALITHDAKHDTCQINVREYLLFDLSPFRRLLEQRGWEESTLFLITFRGLYEPLEFDF